MNTMRLLPSISVVIPCYNAGRWVGRAIESALDQNYPNLEVIVIDDGSTDNSLDVIRSFGTRIRWETGPNRGAAAARNRGLSMTNADYVLFLDADDYIEPGSIMAWVGAAHSADLVLGPFAFERAGFRQARQQPHKSVDNHRIITGWLSGLFTPTCSVLWCRTFLHNIGGWDEQVIRNDDGELVLRALLESARVALADDGLGVYVQHDGPERVSKRSGRAVLLDAMDIYSGLLQRARCHGGEIHELGFARGYYGLASEAFSHQLDDIGELALQEARALGLRGHIGSPAHRMLATVLGLRMKVRLVKALRSRRAS